MEIIIWKQIASGNLPYGSGNSNRTLYQFRGVGDGREVQKRGDMCIPMADSCFDRKQKNSVKQVYFNKKYIKKKEMQE